MDRWIGILISAGRQLWNLGEIPDEQIEERITRACIAAGFPAQEPGVDEVTLYAGEPHPTVVLRGTVRESIDLDRVTPAAIAAYQDTLAAGRRQSQLNAARVVVSQLHPDDKVTLRGEMGGSPAPRPARSQS